MASRNIFLLLIFAVVTVFSEEPSGTMDPYENKRTQDSSMSELYETKCTEDDESFCLHGHCTIHQSLGEPICRCDFGFTGERCEHLILSAINVKETDATQFAIWLGAGLLITGLIALIWFYKKERCKKSRQNNETCNTEEQLSQVNV
ncbi:hypothetical protein GDO81_000790 [Engystomops pustulosus]|uniref:EGF-like domain-containing protein n=1 Tax=Engystomops pustulosus TaxID=76066 RepID=A0AAV7D7A3_ENGPU|nr:hypothetical protein GDO81_000790 [Engystomops pustulosus]